MTPKELTEALERMLLIRAYEQSLVAMQQNGTAAGTCTSVGQEASAVGVVSALSRKDKILTNHRSAGHLLARGANPDRMIAEVMGKEGGYCGGKSGSLHISVAELGVVLTSTIVGGELGMVTGVALSESMLGGEGIVACFFGDGASCEGRFHESVNLAAVWKLPILYVCENNHWQAFVHRDETMLGPSIAARMAGYGIEAASVDGNDVEAVFEAARKAAATVRASGKPYLLETLTYRQRGHYEPDDQAYVDKDELARWMKRDPIQLLKHRLESAGHLSAEALGQVETRVAARIAAAVAFAKASPYPPIEQLTTHVYA
jgi:TPP-dependent pyruvate/acetoin dehydrogenase alpha subunit